ncbi:M48 family metallopeptidase [Actinoallomurus sp. CA-150999]|uniref:M48 family metallopeptidase n=1 Tax=Actinoallomurus sp. CA-150999 TaxID=3239887 RepID=UPI003D937A77
MSSESVAVTCPECSQTLTENEGYRTWCPECDWNLTDDFGRPRRGLVRRRLDDASAALVLSLYDDVRSGENLRPGWNIARVTSYAVAICIHLITIGIAVAAVAVGLLYPVFPAFLLSLLLLAIAFFIRPRFGRIPKSSFPLARTDAPQLYRLMDRVADEVGARRVDVIAVDRLFNASCATVGLRRRRVVVIGLPLWNALTPEERISVLSHEMGHAVNGDSRHLLVVGTALHTLERLYVLLRRDREWEAHAPGLFALMGLALRLAKWLLRPPVAGTYLALSLLTLRAGQRAEYLADRLAAVAASPAAAAGALDKVRTVEEALLPAVHFQAAFPQKVVLWKKHRELIARIPALELERRRRISAAAEHRVDHSHPPTHLRITLLREFAPTEPRISLTSQEVEAIESELAPLYARIAGQLAAPYRAANYAS